MKLFFMRENAIYEPTNCKLSGARITSGIHFEYGAVTRHPAASLYKLQIENCLLLPYVCSIVQRWVLKHQKHYQEPLPGTLTGTTRTTPVLDGTVTLHSVKWCTFTAFDLAEASGVQFRISRHGGCGGTLPQNETLQVPARQLLAIEFAE